MAALSNDKHWGPLKAAALGALLSAAGLVVFHACSVYDSSLLHHSDASAGPDTLIASEADSSQDSPEASEEATADAFDASDASEATLESAVEDSDSSTSDGPAPCSQTQSDCDGDEANGCEANLTTDGKNCGECGRDCLGGSCTSGVCGAVVLATGQVSPSSVADDETYVYWTNAVPTGAVMRMDKKGGTPEIVATSALTPGGLAVDTTAVFWNEIAYNKDGTLWRTDKSGLGDGGGSVALATTQAGSIAVALEGEYVYWTTPGTVRRVPKSGGNYETLASGYQQTGGLVAQLGYLFWTDLMEGTVYGFDVPNGPAELMASGQNQPAGLTADFTNLYWTNMTGPDGGTARVMTIAKVNQTTPTVLADGQAAPIGIAQSGSYVYWTNSAGGTVMRILKVGGTPEQLASGQGAPAGIVVDSTAVFWANRDDGRILKIAK